jgi:hypothetical protein
MLNVLDDESEEEEEVGELALEGAANIEAVLAEQVHVCVCVCVCVCVHVRVRACVRVYAGGAGTYLYMQYVYMYVCVCVYIYIMYVIYICWRSRRSGAGDKGCCRQRWNSGTGRQRWIAKRSSCCSSRRRRWRTRNCAPTTKSACRRLSVSLSLSRSLTDDEVRMQASLSLSFSRSLALSRALFSSFACLLARSL